MADPAPSWTRARPATCRCASPATRRSASTSTGTSSASPPWSGREGVVRDVLRHETFDDELDQTLARAAEGCAPGTPNNVRVAARAKVAAELDQLMDLRPFRVARLHRS